MNPLRNSQVTPLRNSPCIAPTHPSTQNLARPSSHPLFSPSIFTPLCPSRRLTPFSSFLLSLRPSALSAPHPPPRAPPHRLPPPPAPRVCTAQRRGSCGHSGGDQFLFLRLRVDADGCGGGEEGRAPLPPRRPHPHRGDGQGREETDRLQERRQALPPPRRRVRSCDNRTRVIPEWGLRRRRRLFHHRVLSHGESAEFPLVRTAVQTRTLSTGGKGQFTKGSSQRAFTKDSYDGAPGGGASLGCRWCGSEHIPSSCNTHGTQC